MPKNEVISNKVQVTKEKNVTASVAKQSPEIASSATPPRNDGKTSRPQILKGLVVAAKLPMSVTVVVERQVMHPLYRKSTLRSKRYLVHDELGVKEGDVVEIIGVKPMSANKFFQVSKVVGRDLATIITEELKEEAAEAIAEVLPAEPEAPESSSENLESSNKKEVVKPERKK